ncbi:hypothetical protein [Pseudomonas sp. HLT2-19-2]
MSIQTAFVSPAALNDAGTLDTTFAGTGKTQVYFAGSLSSMANGVAIDSRGRFRNIVVGGYSLDGNYLAVVARYLG